MQAIQRHFRNVFLAGVFAAIPVAVTAFVLIYVERATREAFHVSVPFLGVAIAIAGIYLLGLTVTSLLGRLLLRGLDRLLLHLPILRGVYSAWKQVSLIPAGAGGAGGTFARVVLVRLDNLPARTLAFTSGQPIPGDRNTACIFVPNAPNPTSGRLYFVPLPELCFLDLSAEEAFKILLSGGNYLPPALTAATR